MLSQTQYSWVWLGSTCNMKASIVVTYWMILGCNHDIHEKVMFGLNTQEKVMEESGKNKFTAKQIMEKFSAGKTRAHDILKVQFETTC